MSYEPDDENERQTDRERHARSTNRRTWVVVILLVLVASLGCMGLIGLAVVWGFRAFTTDMPAAQDAAGEFLDMLEQERFDDAYAMTTANFQSKKDRKQFEDFIKSYEMFAKNTTRSITGSQLFQNPDGKRVFAQMTLRSPNNAMTCTIVMLQVDGAWKVDDITVP